MRFKLRLGRGSRLSVGYSVLLNETNGGLCSEVERQDSPNLFGLQTVGDNNKSAHCQSST